MVTYSLIYCDNMVILCLLFYSVSLVFHHFAQFIEIVKATWALTIGRGRAGPFGNFLGNPRCDGLIDYLVKPYPGCIIVVTDLYFIIS